MTVEQIAERCLRLMEKTIENELPFETCPEKKIKREWQKEKIRGMIAAQLQPMLTVGPKQLK